MEVRADRRLTVSLMLVNDILSLMEKKKIKGEQDNKEDPQPSNFLFILLQISYLKDFSSYLVVSECLSVVFQPESQYN